MFLILLPSCSQSKIKTTIKKQDEPEIQTVQVDKTRFLVKKSDGSYATNKELIGAMLVASNENGIKETYRIDSIEGFKSEFAGDIFIYTFSTKDPQTGKWQNFCKPDRYGQTKAFPIGGYWDKKGNHIASKNEYLITCMGATIGKCVLWGYAPWKTTKDGDSLWKYHQACTRMIRADYCGNGRSHTLDGTRIELWDRLNIQTDTHEKGLSFEAAWNEHGAVCLKKTRIPHMARLQDIFKECPQKFKDLTRHKKCPENFDNPSVLILNRSPDKNN